MLTQDDWREALEELAPQAKDDLLDAMAQALPTVCENVHLDTLNKCAHALTQWIYETQGLTRLEENLNYRAARLRKVFPKYVRSMAQAETLAGDPKAIANLVYGGRLGNRPGTDDGWTYRGGGITHLTGRENYDKAGYVDRPDEVRRMPGALITAAWFWDKNRINRVADSNTAASVAAVTKVVNGGDNGLEERTVLFRKVYRVLKSHWPDAEVADAIDHEDAPPTSWASLTPDPVVTKKLSKGEIEGLQQRLHNMGYREVGKIDGLWGGRTVGALSAFQTDKGLEVTGKLDAATQAALTLPFVRPVSQERATATVSSLAKQGSIIAQESLKQKAMAWILWIVGIVVGAVKGIAEYWDSAKGMVGGFQGVFANVPDWVWLLVIASVGYWLFMSGDRTGKARVDDERSGKTA